MDRQREQKGAPQSTAKDRTRKDSRRDYLQIYIFMVVHHSIMTVVAQFIVSVAMMLVCVSDGIEVPTEPNPILPTQYSAKW